MENKLIRILDKSFMEQYEKRGLLTAQHTASDLLANGVIVPKQGKWVIAGKDENDMCIFQCSNCDRKQYGATFYCSTCGFEMINAKEREG